MQTGLRWWIQFTHKLGIDPLLYTAEDLSEDGRLPAQVQRTIELKLLLFTCWLARPHYKPDGAGGLIPRGNSPLKGKVLRGYCIHVQMWMQHMVHGVPFGELVRTQGRLKALWRALERLRPGQVRVKQPFTPEHFRELQRAAFEVRASVRGVDEKFRAARTEMMVSAGLEGLLRTSEMALGTSDSASNLAPFRLYDLHFCYQVGTTEMVCEWRDDGTIDTSRAEYLRVPMTPTKPDQSGQRGDELFFPRSGSAMAGTFELVRDFVNDFPLARWRHDAPWFRSTRLSAPSLVTHAQFMADFRYLCRLRQLAPPTGTWGKHAFRVGGLNALQHAGASSVEILALGRWTGDAWRVYSRRHRAAMVKWTAAVLRPVVD